jgi:hypothetical protein
MEKVHEPMPKELLPSGPPLFKKHFDASILISSLPATINTLAKPLLDKFLKLQIELLSHEKTKS